GRPHEVRGAVERGDGRGGTVLGFPTANVAVPNEIQLPADGIYAGWYERPDGSTNAAAISIGRRPTFYPEGGPLMVEAYLLDFDGDLYGERARLRFVSRLRGEERFESADALVAQMNKDVDANRIPTHIGCVMDGNGRWAEARGLPRTEGHKKGEDALFEAVEGALELGVKWLTVYAFSTENWRRPPDEVRFLVNFNESILMRRRDELHERNVRIRFIGRRDWRVPRRLLRQMDESLELTRRNKGMNLVIAFNYGGRAELVDAV